MASSASMTSSSFTSMSSSMSTTLPSSLAFLVSNFHSLVTIKLDSGNYLLWKTQVVNALRANGYIAFLEGTITCPSATIVDSSNNSIANPEFLTWTLIDNQLLSCLTASLSAATLPHVLGLEHVSQVWCSLEQRFNSLTRSRIHELKSKLYNVKKSGPMEGYIDEIRGYKQQLEAVGHHVDDDDLVFYALNGLPTEFDPIKSGLRLKGDVTFDELTSILTAEESHIHKGDAMTSAKVFVSTQKNLNGSFQGQFSNVHQQSSPYRNQNFSGSGSSTASYTPMFQNSQGSNPYFPQQYYSNSNRNMSSSGGFSRNRGNKGSGFGQNQKSGCQICGKNNHTAFYCYHRQNMDFQPPSFMPPPVGRPMSQSWYGGNSVSNQGMVQNIPMSSGPPPQVNMLQFSGQSGSVGYPTSSYLYGSSGSQGYSHGEIGVSGHPQSQSSVFSSYGCPQNLSSSTSEYPVANVVSAPPYSIPNQHQSCAPGDGVLVGNGSSLPVTHSGQTHSANLTPGALSSRAVSHHELL